MIYPEARRKTACDQLVFRRVCSILFASRSGAELMQMQNGIGTFEVGKYADIIATQGNPRNDISVMQKITFVMRAEWC